MGMVSLMVADLEAVAGFYERTIGLERVDGDTSAIRMGAGGRPLVGLVAAPDAPARPAGTTGLFHLAILVPSRPALAAALERVAGSGWRFTGASDHLVSEALYLRDPEGNGIEIYRDRPRAQWPVHDGQLQMDTLPLDLHSLRAETGEGGNGMPAGTVIGHVHLNVADIPASESFYSGLLGFDVTVRGYPGALFVSAGGYHHHLGLNTWVGEGAPPPPAGSRGLARYEIVVPGGDALDEIRDRLAEAGFQPEASGDAIRVADPSGNEVVLGRA